MDLTGRTLGNYDVLQEIGRGGMAVVYRAYQRSLNRHVAIKVLPPHMSHDREFVERFQREALASAQLRHPNIIVIHDVAQEQGIYYIVMELLEGRSLRQMVEQEGALPVERATRIVEQVASALDYAHQRGLVHRDVKPANIFVGKDDHVTLADFGIAKAASETQQLTRTGMLMGTPEYMSPEQAEGGEVDHRTDLYALGVVAYQMLAGRVPFRGTTPHAVLHAVIYEPPPPLRQLRPDLPQALETAVMRAIDKRPERRYQSGAEFSAALHKAPSVQRERLVVPASQGFAKPASTQQAAAQPRPGQTVPAPPPTGAEAAVSKKPLVWILVAIVVVLVGLAVLFAFLILGGDEPGEATSPPTTAIAVITQMATSAPPMHTATAPAEPPTATWIAIGVTEAAGETPEPPTATWIAVGATETPTPTPTPPPPPTPCAILPAGIFAALWQDYRDELGCPLFPDAKLIQDAEQLFDNGHMFWRQDNDYAYVVYEKGTLAGRYQAFTDLWTEGDPEYSCPASPPPGKIQPKRGFGAVWCELGAASAPIGWGLLEEAGFGPGYGDPLVQQFQHGSIFRDSDGKTTGQAYVFMRDTMTFLRASY